MSKYQVGAVGLVVVSLWWTIGDGTSGADLGEQRRIAPAEVFMRAKLASSKQVMEGLVVEDFNLIRKAAEDMLNMSRHAEWPQAEDEVYKHFSEEFQRKCSQLSRRALKQDHEGAHFAFLGVTSACVNCHNYVRRSFRVERDESNLEHPVRLIPAEWDEPNTNASQNDHVDLR